MEKVDCGNMMDKCLVLAVKQGSRELVDQIIDAGACDWNAALIAAAEHGHIEFLDLFLDKGVKISRPQAISLNRKVPIFVAYILDRGGVDLR